MFLHLLDQLYNTYHGHGRRVWLVFIRLDWDCLIRRFRVLHHREGVFWLLSGWK